MDSPETAKAPIRVLVAEDEALIRMDLVEMLSDLGYEVIGEAADGESAIRLAEQLRPDVVMMDVKMPVLDGITAAERIAEQQIAPVVMLTAFSQRELVDRATAAGVMAYLVKPFNQVDLAPAIDVAVARYNQFVTLTHEVADLGERLETRKKVDRAKALLQKVYGLSEADAFRWLQKSAMDRRLSMREVADVVIAEASPAPSE